VILESVLGFFEVARNFRSIEPAIVEFRIPNSRNTDRRVDVYIVQWKRHGWYTINLAITIRKCGIIYMFCFFHRTLPIEVSACSGDREQGRFRVDETISSSHDPKDIVDISVIDICA
jgi:hypothetical protein